MNFNLTDSEFKKFSGLIYQYCGISLDDTKKELLKARLQKRLYFYNFTKYRHYYDYIVNNNNKEELIELINAVSTNVTHFFREDAHFDFMKKLVLPEILAKKQNQKSNKLRIWSCASSSGEEIYSIVITVLESLNNIINWDFKILGTDISTKVLKIAQEGVYSKNSINTVPLMLRDKYFDSNYQGKNTSFKVKDIVKKYTVFKRLNLMNKQFPFSKKFDMIFCRNVMIYFDKETQQSLLQKLHYYLNDGGYLFIGHSESMIGLKLKFKQLAPALFQKV